MCVCFVLFCQPDQCLTLHGSWLTEISILKSHTPSLPSTNGKRFHTVQSWMLNWPTGSIKSDWSPTM